MEVTNELNDIVKDLLQRYKDSIGEHNASGNLEKSASYRCTFNGKFFEVIFNLQDYWKYLENGTKPHFPPIDAIERWVTIKKLIPRAGSNGKVPSTKQLAYLIAREISINGTKPTKLLQNTINSSDDLINAICDELTKQLEQELDKEEL